MGKNPENGEDIIASNGRFGPYIKCGTDTRSLPADMPPIDVTLDQAMALLKQPKALGRGRGTPKPPLKSFEGNSPITEQPVRVLDGRYGPYVTDGETNASLPRGAKAEEANVIGKITTNGTRAAIRTVIRYRYGVLNGKGASLLDGYMEDLATDRIYRLMIAQRIRHRECLEMEETSDQIRHTPETISQMFDQELDRILRELPPGADRPVIENYRTARDISEFLIQNQEFDPI